MLLPLYVYADDAYSQTLLSKSQYSQGTITLQEHLIHAPSFSGIRVAHLLLCLSVCYYFCSMYFLCVRFPCVVFILGIHFFLFLHGSAISSCIRQDRVSDVNIFLYSLIQSIGRDIFLFSSKQGFGRDIFMYSWRQGLRRNFLH